MLVKLYRHVNTIKTSVNLLAKDYAYKGTCFNKLIRHSIYQPVRSVSHSNGIGNPKVEERLNEVDADNFITIYANPGVRYFAVINKSVWYPTVLGIGAYPASLLLFASGFITLQTVATTLFLSTWSCMVIHVFAMNVWRKVGFLYTDKEITKLKVSYVGYWGKRHDVILPIEDVMLFSDMPKTPFDYLYRKVKTFNARRFEFYKLDLYNKDAIVKRDIFEKIFGSTL